VGRALIVLTGGGTGIGLLKRVADRAGSIDWSKVHLFWGDERYVPHDDDERKREAGRRRAHRRDRHPRGQTCIRWRQATASTATTSSRQRWHTSRSLPLNAEPGQPVPDFDVHLLGMGPEGHINSLFPNSRAVLETKWFRGSRSRTPPRPPPRRITLTLPAIQRSREVWLVCAGEKQGRRARGRDQRC